MSDPTSGRPAANLWWLVALAVFGGVAGLVNGWFVPTAAEVDWYDTAVTVAAAGMILVPVVLILRVVLGAVSLGLAVCYVPRAADAWRVERAAWLTYYAALDQAEAADRDNAAATARDEADGKAWAARRKVLLGELKDLGRDGDPDTTSACQRELEAGEAAWGDPARAAAKASRLTATVRLREQAAVLGVAAGTASDARIWYDRRTFGELAYTMSGVGPKLSDRPRTGGGSHGK